MITRTIACQEEFTHGESDNQDRSQESADSQSGRIEVRIGESGGICQRGRQAVNEGCGPKGGSQSSPQGREEVRQHIGQPAPLSSIQN